MSNVYELRPPAAPAAVEQVEPLEAAVRELSARIAQNNEERGLTPSLRRRRPRALPPAPPAPVAFAIEEATASAPAPLQLARGGR
jgi:hypothetical protein